MIDKRLAEQLESVRRHLLRRRLFTVLAVVWLSAAAIGAGLLVAGHEATTTHPWFITALGGATLLIAAVAAWLATATTPDLVEVARRVEDRYPELNAKLLAAVAQADAASDGRRGFLQAVVIADASAHGRFTGWNKTASPSWTWLACGVQFLSLALCLLVFMRLVSEVPTGAESFFTVTLPAKPAIAYEATITPGDVELERGTSLLVLARFAGQLPAETSFAYQPAGGETQRTAMTKSLDDPIFAARLPSVQADLTYSVEYADVRSPTYRVTVFEYPELDRADVQLAFPAYTEQPEKLVEDTFEVTAVEGTQVTLIARLNKDVARAELVGGVEPAIELTAAANEKHVYTATLPLTKTVRYRLHLVDDRGRENKEPPEFRFTALVNRRPEIKLAFPSKDVQVSPLEELPAQAEVWDDFGVAAYGIAYSLDGAKPKEIDLGKKVPAKEHRDALQLLSFEEFQAEPDQLLTYYFYADDVGGDGKPRRTLSDMFFCEVRPFEEIFREGEAPAGGEGQPSEAGEEAEKLAELQKQVINATWKLIRRETDAAPSDKYAADSQVLVEGEQEVLALADELAEKLEDDESKAYLAAAQKHMQRALEMLQQAAGDPPSVAPLTPALAAEQAAYQALLKLRAREHSVVKGRQSKGKGAAGRSSSQLSQLELKSSENRYEQQKTAGQQQQDAAQKETREVLNRLKELAERQEDLNRRIKEMQAALEAAETEAEKDEILRRLKRLRDEERQILRDSDELRNRMEQPENQREMAEAKQQLDQTRSHVQQASEALEKGLASQAAAAGARAEQKLQALRDEFRKKSAGQFTDEMRELRNEARELEQNQQAIAEKLADSTQPKTKSLREPSGREQLLEGLEQQKADLEKLLESMRRTVEEAESAEPLLAKQLYDAIRQAHQQRPGEALEMTQKLLERGFTDESKSAEAQARAGIGELKDGVEKAAESVLGDETEAIRRARDAVDQLAQAIDQEMRQATGRGGERQPNDAQNQSGKQPSEQANREAADAGKPGRGKPSEGEKPEQGEGRGNGETKPGAKPQAGGDPSGEGQGEGRQPGNQQGGPGGGNPNGRGGLRDLAEAVGGFSGPLTGGDFRPWADALRDVEEMLDDPQLRAEAAKIRDRASALRAEFKRHSEQPNWELVNETISKPLNELRVRLAEELLKRQQPDSLVPLDRDPVPPQFAEPVRRYYERLGSGQ